MKCYEQALKEYRVICVCVCVCVCVKCVCVRHSTFVGRMNIYVDYCGIDAVSLMTRDKITVTGLQTKKKKKKIDTLYYICKENYKRYIHYITYVKRSMKQ